MWEEVNRIEKGAFYQFPYVEGYNETDEPRPAEVSPEIEERGPAYTYEHNAFDRAVIGGVVYRDGPYAELEGKYIFADSYSAKIFLMEPAERVETVTVLTKADQFAQRGVSSVTQLSNGDLLVTTLGAASSPSGEVLKLVPGDEVDDSTRPAPADTLASAAYDPAVMKGLFSIQCARCHGANGDGQGPDSGAMGVPMPNFTTAAFHEARSDEDIYNVIANGGAAYGMSALMPPWKGLLKEQDINNLVRYVRELQNTK